jgi:hypothetical protein
MRRVALAALVLLSVSMFGSGFAVAEDSPRVKCLTKCLDTLKKCLKDAGKDQTKKSACNKAVNDCQKLCPQP